MASLARRLEVARATHNAQLVELLEQEKRQVVAPAPTPERAQSRTSWFHTLRERISKALFGTPELQACQFVNGSDHWWYAIDPQTGECVYADSEAELRVWIEQNYRGR